MPTIELIGAINGQDCYAETYIAEILTKDREQLTVGTEFTGRPNTCIYVNEHDVVKIRAELELSHANARKWTHKVLQQEQLLTVHHPKKTWFIAIHADTSRVLVGSICPRLIPLNVKLKTKPKNREERQGYLNCISAMFEKYLVLAKNSDHKLDEGLSNFGVDDAGDVYYLDDEYYTWDNFISFAIMLGVFIRSIDWLDNGFMVAMTENLVALIESVFQDPHCRIIIANQLEPLFMPSEQKERLLKKMRTVLEHPPANAAIHLANKKRLNARKNNNNRYYAVLADIHANDAALDVVLNFYREQKITQGIVLGDIVGYGPEPQACIDRLEASPFEIIKGNHDHAVATNNTTRGFSSNAKTVIEWTIAQLDQDYKNWLNSLPAYAQNQHWLAVHGAPIDPAFFYGYVYQMTAEENLDYLQEKKIALCLHGHSHAPGVYGRDRRNINHHLTDATINLSAFRHSLVCPGSVGQPRNGYQATQCAIYDREKQEMVFVALPYNVEPVVEKMKQRGLPEILWQRLLTGI